MAENTPEPVVPASPPDGGQTPPAPSPVEPGASSSTPAAPVAPTAPVAPPVVETVTKERLDREIADKWAQKRRADNAEAQRLIAERALEDFQRTPGTTPSTAQTFTAADVDRLAEQKAAQQRYDADCMRSIGAGRRAHEDFNNSLSTFQTAQVPRHTVEAVLAVEEEFGAPGELLYALGRDTQELDRIMSLPLLRQSAALATYASKQKVGSASLLDGGTEVREISRVAAPVAPKVGGNVQRSVAEMSIDDPDLPIAEFMRRRDAEAKKAKERA